MVERVQVRARFNFFYTVKKNLMFTIADHDVDKDVFGILRAKD